MTIDLARFASKWHARDQGRGQSRENVANALLETAAATEAIALNVTYVTASLVPGWMTQLDVQAVDAAVVDETATVRDVVKLGAAAHGPLACVVTGAGKICLGSGASRRNRWLLKRHPCQTAATVVRPQWRNLQNLSFEEEAGSRTGAREV